MLVLALNRTKSVASAPHDGPCVCTGVKAFPTKGMGRAVACRKPEKPTD